MQKICAQTCVDENKKEEKKQAADRVLIMLAFAWRKLVEEIAGLLDGRRRRVDGRFAVADARVVGVIVARRRATRATSLQASAVQRRLWRRVQR